MWVGCKDDRNLLCTKVAMAIMISFHFVLAFMLCMPVENHMVLADIATHCFPSHVITSIILFLQKFGTIWALIVKNDLGGLSGIGGYKPPQVAISKWI